jgi:hypothetical protein
MGDQADAARPLERGVSSRELLLTLHPDPDAVVDSLDAQRVYHPRPLLGALRGTPPELASIHECGVVVVAIARPPDETSALPQVSTHGLDVREQHQICGRDVTQQRNRIVIQLP